MASPAARTSVARNSSSAMGTFSFVPRVGLVGYRSWIREVMGSIGSRSRTTFGSGHTVCIETYQQLLGECASDCIRVTKLAGAMQSGVVLSDVQDSRDSRAVAHERKRRRR